MTMPTDNDTPRVPLRAAIRALSAVDEGLLAAEHDGDLLLTPSPSPSTGTGGYARIRATGEGTYPVEVVAAPWSYTVGCLGNRAFTDPGRAVRVAAAELRHHLTDAGTADGEDRLRALLSTGVVLPQDVVLAYHARHDPVWERTYRSLVLRPSTVDPDTFRFGCPGAYASVRLAGEGYRVDISAFDVAYTVQSMGRVVTYADPAEAIQTAAWVVRDHVERGRRRGPR